MQLVRIINTTVCTIYEQQNCYLSVKSKST